MTGRCLVILLAFFVTGFASSRKVPPELHFLARGQYIKVDTGQDSKKRWVAKKIELVAADTEFEIEGNVHKLDRKGKFSLGTLRIEIYEKTKLESAQKEPRTFSDVRNGERVRVKTRSIKGKTVKARTIRIFGPSGDTDLELTGPVESVNFEESQILLLANKILVDRKTRYANLDTSAPKEHAEAEESEGRYIRRDDDEQHPDPIRIGRLFVGGRVYLEHERSRNLDLDAAELDSEDWLRPEAEVEMSLPLGELSEAYAKFNFTRPILLQEDPDQSRNDANVREAYLLMGFHRSVAVQVGRQRFRDKREWLYDDQLDAVRLHLRPASKLNLQFSAAQALVRPSGSRSDQFHLMAHSEYEFSSRRYLSAHVIKRNDLTSRDEDPIWFGVASRGRIVPGLDYWAESSYMKGRREARLLRGYAYDVGGSYRIPLPLQPTIAAGYAFGSGDNNLDDGVDGNFRQTRLNDNSSRYNGLKRYRYYGILLEPELYNLRIETVDFGLRHARYWSLNLSVHTYRQVVASKKVGDMVLTAGPRGRDPRLGKEVDAVLAIRGIPRIDVNMYGGLFVPGPAFTGERARGFLFRQEIKVYF